MLLTVGGLKGGLGKSTTAWFLGTGLAATGRTLLVDADPASQSLYGWYLRAVDNKELMPFDLQPWSTPDLARKLRGMLDRYDHILIDSGGETSRLFNLACQVTGELLIPVGPYTAELERLPATFAAAIEAEQEAGEPVTPRILLVKVDGRTNNGRDARAYLDGLGLPVMAATVRFSVPDYARTPGHVPTDLGDYAAVLAELLATEPARAASSEAS